jgi:uncharacterized protein YbjT (DUF2867 family)
MAGCDHLFLLSPPSPHQPEQERTAIDAAKRVGVGHVVALSVLGSSPDASVAFGRWHGEIDRHLAESGLPDTLLLPSGFMQNFLASAQYVADQGILYGMTGETRGQLHRHPRRRRGGRPGTDQPRRPGQGVHADRA